MTRDGDQLLALLQALASRPRLQILAVLASGRRQYVSRLAREVNMSRPLLHLHLKKLEEAGLVASNLELSDEGKALNYFQVTDFSLILTPAVIADAAASLTTNPSPDG